MPTADDLEYYSVLGLKPGASVAEIKAQYRRMAKQFHPDRNEGDAWHQEHLKKIIAAYEVLSDPDRKAAYDLRLTHTQRSGPETAKRATAGIRSPPGFLIATVVVGFIAIAGLITLQHQPSSDSNRLPPITPQPPTIATPAPVSAATHAWSSTEAADTSHVPQSSPPQKSATAMKAAIRVRFQAASSRINALIELGNLAASSPVDSSTSPGDASRATNISQLRIDLDTLRTQKAQVTSELDAFENLQSDDSVRAEKLDTDFRQLEVPYQAVKADLLFLNSVPGNTNASQ